MGNVWMISIRDLHPKLIESKTPYISYIPTFLHGYKKSTLRLLQYNNV